MPGFYCLDNENQVIQIKPDYVGEISSRKDPTIYKHTGYGDDFKEQFIPRDSAKIWKSESLDDVEMIEIEPESNVKRKVETFYGVGGK